MADAPPPDLAASAAAPASALPAAAAAIEAVTDTQSVANVQPVTDASVRADASAPTDAVGAARRPQRRLRFAVAFGVGLLLCLAAGGAALAAWDASFNGRILPGVHSGSVDLSGLDREQAAAALADAYGSYARGNVVIHTEAGDVLVPYDAFSRRPDIDALVDAAMQAGRSGPVAERVVNELRLATRGVDLLPSVTFDETALRSRVASALAALERKPADALVAMGSQGILTAPARSGRRFDPDTVEAAAVAAAQAPTTGSTIEVDASAAPVTPARGDAPVAAAVTAADRMVGNVVVTLGKKHWTIKAATVRTWITFGAPGSTSVAPRVDGAAVAKALAPVARAVNQKPVSATFLRNRGGRIIGVAAGANGRHLDVAATSAAIVEELASRANGTAPASLAVSTQVVVPKVTTEEARKTAPLMVKLSSWKTWFPISERNFYGANIWQPAKFINGTLLRPGQTFEWWRAIGPVTSARGFGLGGFIAGDHTEPTGAMGGGMCSSSTTLFNAALRAGLRMGARDNHRYYINRYPLGLDATVSNSQTMSFTNDMSTPILIRAFRIGGHSGRGWVRYEIWGIPDGRKVTIGKPHVSNFQKATTRIESVSTLRRGQRLQTEYPSDGMDVTVNRVVRNAHGRVIHNETYRTHYQRWDGIIQVGR